MDHKRHLTLRQMQARQSGVVVQVLGGHGLISRLDALGIRQGKRITKISSMLMRGPVAIGVDNAQVAVGYGMANKIIIEVDTR